MGEGPLAAYNLSRMRQKGLQADPDQAQSIPTTIKPNIPITLRRVDGIGESVQWMVGYVTKLRK